MRNKAIIILLLVQLTVFLSGSIALKGQSRSDSLLTSKMRECMDSLYSPSFLRMVEGLRSEAVAQKDTSLALQAARLLVYRYYEISNTDSLVVAVESAKRQARKYENLVEYFSVWAYLVNHYTITGMTGLAMFETENMFEAAEKYRSDYGRAAAYTAKGETCLYLNLFPEAEKYLNIAEQILSNATDAPSLYSLLSNMQIQNVVETSIGQYAFIPSRCERMDTLLKVLRLGAMAGYSYDLEMASECTKARYYIHEGDTGQAWKHIVTANKYLQESSSQYDYMLETMGLFYTSTGEYSKAMDYYRVLEKYLDGAGMELSKIKAIAHYADIQAVVGDYTSAYRNYKRITVIRDSVENIHFYKQLTDLNNLNASQMAYKSHKNIIVGLTGFMLFLVMVSFAYSITILKSRRKIRKYNVYLEKAYADVKRSDEMKSAFIKHIHHEIRTPLNSIVGFSYILQNTTDPEEQKQCFDLINDNNRELLKIVDDLLTMTAGEKAKSDETISEFSIGEMLDILNKIYRPLFEKASISFVSSCPPSVTYTGYRSKIMEIIDNFLSNALKFTPSGGCVTLSCTPVRSHIQISVQDTGCGIAPENLKKIYEPFFKVDEFSQGMGIGLSICQSLADAINAQIELSSRPGEGSTFTLVL